MRCLSSIAITCLSVTVLALGGAEDTQDTRVERSLRFAPGSAKTLEVDTVWGSIDVVGHDSQTVDVVALRRVTAGTTEAREAAQREVTLEIADNAPTVRLYVDGPFRERDGGRGWRGRSDAGYEVRYDFELRVPRDAELLLRTVNHGSLRVTATDGDFELRNVNGPIDLVDITGSGVARTVNGDVKVSYRANPRTDVTLATLNGDVIARFGKSLSADLWVKTTHGEVFTDFDVTPLASPPAVAERHGQRRVWRTSPKAGVRVGEGGPALEFETMNGDIRILWSTP